MERTEGWDTRGRGAGPLDVDRQGLQTRGEEVPSWGTVTVVGKEQEVGVGGGGTKTETGGRVGRRRVGVHLDGRPTGVGVREGDGVLVARVVEEPTRVGPSRFGLDVVVVLTRTRRV